MNYTCVGFINTDHYLDHNIECDLKHKCVRHEAYRRRNTEGRINSRTCMNYNHKYLIAQLDKKPNCSITTYLALRLAKEA